MLGGAGAIPSPLPSIEVRTLGAACARDSRPASTCNAQLDRSGVVPFHSYAVAWRGAPPGLTGSLRQSRTLRDARVSVWNSRLHELELNGQRAGEVEHRWKDERTVEICGDGDSGQGWGALR